MSKPGDEVKKLIDIDRPNTSEVKTIRILKRTWGKTMVAAAEKMEELIPKDATFIEAVITPSTDNHRDFVYGYGMQAVVETVGEVVEDG